MTAANRPRASLGLESHSGWAALVALSGPSKDPAVILRTRLVLADPGDGVSKQPFHAAEEMPFAKAKAFIAAAIGDARRRAKKEIGRALDQIALAGLPADSCGLLLSSGRPLPDLQKVLASHALIHAAEGDHFRDALAEAAEARGLRVVRIGRKELPARAEAALGIPGPELKARIASLGKGLGAPWGQDQKLAALAAWTALAG